MTTLVRLPQVRLAGQAPHPTYRVFGVLRGTGARPSDLAAG